MSSMMSYIWARNRGILNWIPSVWRINFVLEHPLVSGSFYSLYLFPLIPRLFVEEGERGLRNLPFLNHWRKNLGEVKAHLKTKINLNSLSLGIFRQFFFLINVYRIAFSAFQSLNKYLSILYVLGTMFYAR